MAYVKHAVISNGSDQINLMSAKETKDILDTKLEKGDITSGSANVTIANPSGNALTISVTPQPLPDKYYTTDNGTGAVGSTMTGLDLTLVAPITVGKTVATDFDIDDTVVFANGYTADVTAVSQSVAGAVTAGDTYDVIIVSVPIATSFAAITGLPTDNTALSTALSAKADKVTSATNGDLAALDGTGNLTDSGIAVADLALKASSLTNGNLVSADSSGDLEDSGIAVADVMEKVSSATAGDIATLNASGEVVDSGTLLADVALKADGVTTINGSTNKIITQSEITLNNTVDWTN